MIDDAVLEAAFRSHTEGKDKFTRRMAVAIALMADETPRAIVLRLEALDFLHAGSWDWFVANGGITPEHVRLIKSELGGGVMW